LEREIKERGPNRVLWTFFISPSLFFSGSYTTKEPSEEQCN
jgi:hypothetical protein